MISSYEVGAVFKIYDDATPALRRLADEFKALQGVVDQTKATLKEFGATRFTGVVTGLGGIEKGLKGISVQSEKTAGVLGDSFGKISGQADFTVTSIGKIGGSLTDLVAQSDGASNALGAAFGRVGTDADLAVTQVGNLTKALGEAAAAGMAIRIPGAAEAVGGGGARGGGSGRPPSIRNGTRGGGHGGGGGGEGGEGGDGFALHAKGVEVAPGLGVRGHGDWTIAGMVAGFIGYDAFKDAAEFQDVKEQMAISGIPRDKINQASAISFQMGRKYGVTATSVLQTINEIRNPLGGVDEAEQHIDHLGNAMVALRNLDSKNGTKTADQLYDLIKSAEFRGAVDPKSFDTIVDQIVRGSVATGGKVSPADTLQAYKYSRAALPRLSDKFLFNYLPELVQEFGGSGAGTSLASTYQQLVAGSMRTTGLKLLESLGEIDNSKAEFDKNGRIVKVKPGAIRLGDIFAVDPGSAAAKLVADMSAHGITKEEDQRNYISQIFGNRNAAQMITTLAYQYNRLNRGASSIAATMPIDQAAAELKENSPGETTKSLQAAKSNFMTALGAAVQPVVTLMMKDVTGTLDVYTGVLTQKNALKPLLPLAAQIVPKDKDDSFQSIGNRAWPFFEIGKGVNDREKAMNSLSKNYGGGWWDGPIPTVQKEMDFESRRGKALTNLPAAPPPAPIVNTKVEVKVNLDGHAIAAAVESRIVNDGSFMRGPSAFDGRAMPTPVDHGLQSTP